MAHVKGFFKRLKLVSGDQVLDSHNEQMYRALLQYLFLKRSFCATDFLESGLYQKEGGSKVLSARPIHPSLNSTYTIAHPKTSIEPPLST